jgi:hypothetical protein
MQKYHHILTALMAIAVFSILIAISDLVWGLDCSYKPPCPPGLTAQETITCDACCAEGFALTTAADKWCCPIGEKPTEDEYRCIPIAAILKSDGTCYVMNETDPCCREGWHGINKYECCPDGFALSTDNDACCTSRSDGKCCPDKYIWNPYSGTCAPPRPTGVTVR